MRPILTPEEASRLDSESEVPVTTLMERAGYAVSVQAAALGAGYGCRVAVLAGPGNNGGDGYVAARHLLGRGAAVTVHRVASPRSEACRWAARLAGAAGVTARPLGVPDGADLVVDAVFGGGFRTGIPEGLEAWMTAGLPVLAVDVPTGLDPGSGEVAGLAFTAALTVTFGALRTGHVLGEGPDRCGRVNVADIGLPPGVPALRLAEVGDAPRPARPRRAHKWSAGSVLVVGGSPGMVGAAVMAARSALHFGAGAVGIAAPAVQRSVVAGLAPEVLSYRYDDLERVLPRYGVVVLGPGMGRSEQELVHRLLGGITGPVVLDADGLNVVRPEVLRLRSGPTVLTPHAGEFARLAGETASPEAARRLAARTGTVIVLKGSPTFVTDGDVPWAVRSGGAELATIGTGDVLSGVLAALLARGLDPLTAGRSAAYWHGVAGADLGEAGTVTADVLARHVGRFAWEPS